MKKYFQKVSFHGLLSAFSFVFVFCLLMIFIIGNLFDIGSFKAVFVDAWGRGFVWFTIVFVVLCNFDSVREIVKSAVREKMDSLVVSDIMEEVIYKIENDPEMLRKLKDSEVREEKRLFTTKPINPK